jgi:hypothetical protein
MIDQGIHIISGSLGDGKTLRAVQIVEWFLQRGRRVATNVNLNIEYLCKHDCDQVLVTRIPDKPTIEYLKDIGMGSDRRGEHGLLLLDELGLSMNSREFNDKTRLAVIKHCIHMRKKRWVAVFIAQKPEMIDKQVRALGSVIHSCRSTKNIALLKWLPRFHICHLATTFGAKAGTDFYRGTHLFPAFDTEQQFASDLDDKMEKGEPPEIRDSKIWNGYYQLLPPARLNPTILAEAKSVQDQTDFNTLKSTAAAALLAINIFLWWPPGQNIEARTIESSTPAAAISADPQDPVEDLHHRFNSLRIKDFIRIGSNYRYSFTGPQGDVSQETLEFEGFRVQNRGRSEALVVGPNYEFWSIYR